MTRVIVKGAVPIVVILVAICLLMPFLGNRLSPHLLAFFGANPFDNGQKIYVTHLERGLTVPATSLFTKDYRINVSPDGEWIIYSLVDEADAQFALVNLQRWETTVLPELPYDSSFTRAEWQADSQHLWLIAYDDFGTAQGYFIYDRRSTELTESDDEPSPYAGIRRNDIIIGSIIAFNDAQQPVLAVTVDDEGVPRLYDYTSDEPVASIELGLNSPPLSLSSDDQYLAAILTRNQQVDLFLVPAWEGDIVQLTDDVNFEHDVVWSPDGRYIAYTSESRGTRFGSVRIELRVYDVEARQVAYTFTFQSQNVIGNNPPAWIP
ncbi:MAG: hypothetical protein RLP44_17350 [Aggregatilineales bacterium]